MFKHITIELTQQELIDLIKEKIQTIYGQHCNVTFTFEHEYRGYGTNESQELVFKGAKVSLVPKD